MPSQSITSCMPVKRFFPAVLVALALTTTSAGLAAPSAKSALLIEGYFDGQSLRILVDAEKAQAEVTLGEDHHRIDLALEAAKKIAADGSIREEEVMASGSLPTPEIKPWGPGPTIAGHPSVYHVMTLGDEICGELLVSPWMKPFVDPAVQALSILERIKGDAAMKSTGLNGACGALPFSTYAKTGWPLMAGGIEQPIFKTESITFDYVPKSGELTWSN